MSDLKNIQALIAEKAEARLDLDLFKISQFVRDNRLLRITNNPGIPYLHFNDGLEKSQKPYWFFTTGPGTFLDEVKKFWLPIYIEEESTQFIAKVEELSENVKDLFNTVQNLEEY